MSDSRSRKIAFLAHCLLNQNAKVAGLATHPGVFAPLMPLLLHAGVGIVQLPCPEFLHLGPSRPVGTDTFEQYDTPEYRTTCSEIARRAAAEISSYHDAGYRVLCVVGVEGSPSCSVSRVPRLVGHNRCEFRPGMGIFVQEFDRQLKATRLNPPFLGIPESQEAGDLPSALIELRRLLTQ